MSNEIDNGGCPPCEGTLDRHWQMRGIIPSTEEVKALNDAELGDIVSVGGFNLLKESGGDATCDDCVLNEFDNCLGVICSSCYFVCAACKGCRDTHHIAERRARRLRNRLVEELNHVYHTISGVCESEGTPESSRLLFRDLAVSVRQAVTHILNLNKQTDEGENQNARYGSI